MVSRLQCEVKLDSTKVKEIQVVGLLCSGKTIHLLIDRQLGLTPIPGLTLQSLRLHCPSHYVSFLVKDQTLRVPANPRRLRDIRSLLQCLWLVKVGLLSNKEFELVLLTNGNF